MLITLLTVSLTPAPSTRPNTLLWPPLSFFFLSFFCWNKAECPAPSFAASIQKQVPAIGVALVRGLLEVLRGFPVHTDIQRRGVLGKPSCISH